MDEDVIFASNGDAVRSRAESQSLGKSGIAGEKGIVSSDCNGRAYPKVIEVYGDVSPVLNESILSLLAL